MPTKSMIITGVAVLAVFIAYRMIQRQVPQLPSVV
jgi:hypothetical protein